MKYIDISQANVIADAITELLDTEDIPTDAALGGLIRAIHDYTASYPSDVTDEIIHLIEEWPLDGGD